MDFASLIGSFIFLGLIFLGIAYDPNLGFVPGNIVFFFDLPSFFIVVLGTFATGAVANPFRQFSRIFKLIGRVFVYRTENQIALLASIFDLAKIARRNILAIDDSLPSIENTMLRGGLRMVVDRMNREVIVEMLTSEIKYKEQQNQDDTNMLKLMTTLSPALGLIGTLIGLVIVLQNLSDPSKVGPAMSLALITTLYGAILANVMFLPWTNKVRFQNKGMKSVDEMVRDGILLIEQSERPEIIEQILMNYLGVEDKKKYIEIKSGAV